tara:strand:+ start:6290 stop:7633 length:1344 start_codon:yes stop_codon:yes gene_type:complete
MLSKTINTWINPLLVGLLILFSIPLKLPDIQESLEKFFAFNFPIRISLYTFFLPPVAFLGILWNRKRAKDIWRQYHIPLIILAFLFVWMWIGALMSDYPKIALKHSGRYSIYLLTFLAFLFALEPNSIKKSGNIFSGIYLLLMLITFLDWHGKISIPKLLSHFGFHIDLFLSDPKYSKNLSSFFENSNPYAVISVGVFFWNMMNFKNSFILSSLGMAAALYSVSISGSRNGILTLVLCIILLALFNLKNIHKSKKTFLIGTVTLILIFISYNYINSHAVNRTSSIFNRLLKVKSYKDLENLDIRFLIFRSTIEWGFSNPPLLGSGTKTFGQEVIAKSKNLAVVNKNNNKIKLNSHNALLTIWIEMGWIGLIAVLLFLWYWIRPALRAPPLMMMPIIAVCIGQILDYFVWEILFMAFQSFFFAYFAASISLYNTRYLSTVIGKTRLKT